MKVFIIEDEPMARRHLADTLTSNFEDITIVGTAGSVKDSVLWLNDPANEADVIFMDVELSDGKCFDIFRKAEIRSKVVMTTAYDSYAVKAFEVNSVDYLLKPVGLSELRRAVDRCRQESYPLDVERLLQSLNPSKQEQNYKERFLVHLNDHIVPVKTGDIAYFFSEDKDNHVVTKDGAIYVIDSALDSVQSALDPDIFFRISRSSIVAKDSVESITKMLGGRLNITVKAPAGRPGRKTPELTVSRSRVEDFLLWLEK